MLLLLHALQRLLQLGLNLAIGGFLSIIIIITGDHHLMVIMVITTISFSGW